MACRSQRFLALKLARVIIGSSGVVVGELSGDFNHEFISPFLVLGNLKPGASGPTAAATSKAVLDMGVGGVSPALLELLFI